MPEGRQTHHIHKHCNEAGSTHTVYIRNIDIFAAVLHAAGEGWARADAARSRQRPKRAMPRILACAARQARVSRAQDGRKPLLGSRTRPVSRPMLPAPTPSPQGPHGMRSEARELAALKVPSMPAQAWGSGSLRACVQVACGRVLEGAGQSQLTWSSS